MSSTAPSRPAVRSVHLDTVHYTARAYLDFDWIEDAATLTDDRTGAAFRPLVLNLDVFLTPAAVWWKMSASAPSSGPGWYEAKFRGPHRHVEAPEAPDWLMGAAASVVDDLDPDLVNPFLTRPAEGGTVVADAITHHRVRVTRTGEAAR